MSDIESFYLHIGQNVEVLDALVHPTNLLKWILF